MIPFSRLRRPQRHDQLLARVPAGRIAAYAPTENSSRNRGPMAISIRALLITAVVGSIMGCAHPGATTTSSPATLQAPIQPRDADFVVTPILCEDADGLTLFLDIYHRG